MVIGLTGTLGKYVIVAKIKTDRREIEGREGIRERERERRECSAAMHEIIPANEINVPPKAADKGFVTRGKRGCNDTCSHSQHPWQPPTPTPSLAAGAAAMECSHVQQEPASSICT